MRLQPFAAHSIAFQVGRFDRPDRLFRSVRESWLSASGGVSRDAATASNSLQDVKELIPEFFYLPGPPACLPVAVCACLCDLIMSLCRATALQLQTSS